MPLPAVCVTPPGQSCRPTLETPILCLDHVVRTYDDGAIQAVRDVTLRIRCGEWLTIVGPSGSGKSTLLNLMSGLDRPSQGAVLFEGLAPGTAHAWARIRARRIGFIFQAFHLLPTLTALENVQIPLFGVVRSARVRRDRAAGLLERVGLSHRATHRPQHLSAGERQRVAVARALANAPALILADEPTGNLDIESATKIIELLEDIHHSDRTTIVLVTHNPAVARSGTRLITFVDGRIRDAESSLGEPTCHS